MQLRGKISFVSGAGRGIGAAIARRFALEGAILWLSDIDETAARTVAQEIGQGARSLRLISAANLDRGCVRLHYSFQ